MCFVTEFDKIKESQINSEFKLMSTMTSIRYGHIWMKKLMLIESVKNFIRGAKTPKHTYREEVRSKIFLTNLHLKRNKLLTECH